MKVRCRTSITLPLVVANVLARASTPLAMSYTVIPTGQGITTYRLEPTVETGGGVSAAAGESIA